MAPPDYMLRLVGFIPMVHSDMAADLSHSYNVRDMFLYVLTLYISQYASDNLCILSKISRVYQPKKYHSKKVKYNFAKGASDFRSLSQSCSFQNILQKVFLMEMKQPLKFPHNHLSDLILLR